jgi:hypothetical protein
MGMGHSFLGWEECGGDTFADKEGVGQKIVAKKSRVND